MKLIMGVENLSAKRLAGTEHYVLSLARELVASGVAVTIVAPAPADGSRLEDAGGATVRYFGDGSAPTKREILGRDDPRFLDEFSSILREDRADLFHLHSSSSKMGIAHQMAARALGLKTAISLHVAGWFCARYDFMYDGHRQCAETLRPKTCNTCAAKKRFGPKAGPVLASAAGLVGEIGSYALRPLISGKIKIEHFERHVSNADLVHAFANWQRDVLVNAGFPAEKIIVNRQGVRQEFVAMGANARDREPEHSGIRIGYCGRINEAKGINVLLDAISETNNADLEFSIAGEPANSIAGTVQTLVSRGHNVSCVGTLNNHDLVRWYRSMDVICVPSHVVETGPLVTMEALAQGIPVIASRLGGNLDLVRDGENGILFETGDHRALARVLSTLTKNALDEMRVRSTYDRTMATVAGELRDQFSNLLSGPAMASVNQAG